MDTAKTCEYVGLACKHLALQGLSWGYYCMAETGEYDDCEIGEGEMIIYYRGFEFPQSNHGRISFVMEDDGSDDIWMLCCYGVQGPGDHFHVDSVKFPTEEHIQESVKKIAEYLREVRIPVDHSY